MAERIAEGIRRLLGNIYPNYEPTTASESISAVCTLAEQLGSPDCDPSLFEHVVTVLDAMTLVSKLCEQYVGDEEHTTHPFEVWSNAVKLIKAHRVIIVDHRESHSHTISNVVLIMNDFAMAELSHLIADLSTEPGDQTACEVFCQQGPIMSVIVKRLCAYIALLIETLHDDISGRCLSSIFAYRGICAVYRERLQLQGIDTSFINATAAQTDDAILKSMRRNNEVGVQQEDGHWAKVISEDFLDSSMYDICLNVVLLRHARDGYMGRYISLGCASVAARLLMSAGMMAEVRSDDFQSTDALNAELLTSRVCFAINMFAVAIGTTIVSNRDCLISDTLLKSLIDDFSQSLVQLSLVNAVGHSFCFLDIIMEYLIQNCFIPIRNSSYDNTSLGASFMTKMDQVTEGAVMTCSRLLICSLLSRIPTKAQEDIMSIVISLFHQTALDSAPSNAVNHNTIGTLQYTAWLIRDMALVVDSSVASSMYRDYLEDVLVRRQPSSSRWAHLCATGAPIMSPEISDLLLGTLSSIQLPTKDDPRAACLHNMMAAVVDSNTVWDGRLDFPLTSVALVQQSTSLRQLKACLPRAIASMLTVLSNASDYDVSTVYRQQGIGAGVKLDTMGSYLQFLIHIINRTLRDHLQDTQSKVFTSQHIASNVVVMQSYLDQLLVVISASIDLLRCIQQCRNKLQSVLPSSVPDTFTTAILESIQAVVDLHGYCTSMAIRCGLDSFLQYKCSFAKVYLNSCEVMRLLSGAVHTEMDFAFAKRIYLALSTGAIDPSQHQLLLQSGDVNVNANYGFTNSSSSSRSSIGSTSAHLVALVKSIVEFAEKLPRSSRGQVASTMVTLQVKAVIQNRKIGLTTYSISSQQSIVGNPGPIYLITQGLLPMNVVTCDELLDLIGCV